MRGHLIDVSEEVKVPDEAIPEAFAEVKAASSALTTQALALTPLQATLAAAFGAAAGQPGVWPVVIFGTLLFLGSSVAVNALALARVHYRSDWAVKPGNRNAVLREEYRNLTEKALAVKIATWLLLPSALCTALAAARALV